MPYGMTSLKGMYKGQHITLVGNGPSLNPDVIPGMSMACNGIPLIFPQTEWRPDFYVNISRELFKNPISHERVTKMIKTGIPCFLLSGYAKYVGQHRNTYFVSCGIPFHEPIRGDWLQDGYWLVSWMTTMLPMAQIARYLGFTAYTVVGNDGYKPEIEGKDINHFCDEYNADLIPEDRATDAVAMEEQNRRLRIAYDHIERMFYGLQ